MLEKVEVWSVYMQMSNRLLRSFICDKQQERNPTNCSYTTGQFVITFLATSGRPIPSPCRPMPTSANPSWPTGRRSPHRNPPKVWMRFSCCRNRKKATKCPRPQCARSTHSVARCQPPTRSPPKVGDHLCPLETPATPHKRSLQEREPEKSPLFLPSTVPAIPSPQTCHSGRLLHQQVPMQATHHSIMAMHMKAMRVCKLHCIKLPTCSW